MLRGVLSILATALKQLHCAAVIGVGRSHPSQGAGDRICRVDPGMDRSAGGRIETATSKSVLAASRYSSALAA